MYGIYLQQLDAKSGMLHLTGRTSARAATTAPAIQLSLNATKSSVYTAAQRHIVVMMTNGELQYHVVEVSAKSQLECIEGHGSTKVT